ncbi:MAG: hypothetical protein AB7K09_00520 [Planctomycetota bacterium]
MPIDPEKRKAIRKPPVLFKATQKVIAAIEKKLGHSMLAYWNSPSGNVCRADVVAFYEIFRTIGKRDRVSLFIKSDGGYGLASLRMVHLLRQHVKRVTAMIPLNCASAATMLAIGADSIEMGPLAYLTPVDTSLTHDLSPVDNRNDRVAVSQDELARVIGLWQKVNNGSGGGSTDTGNGAAVAKRVRRAAAKAVKTAASGGNGAARIDTHHAIVNSGNPYEQLFDHIHPLVIGAVDRASSLSHRICSEILSLHMSDPKKIAAISGTLNEDYPSHSYPITMTEAQRIGLNAVKLDMGMNDLLLELNELYSEMGQMAVTDFDEHNYHNNEIINILEGRNVQIYYQVNKDWHYRTEERRWTPMNDTSAWHKVVPGTKGKPAYKDEVFHIR